jgi:hypothetical protein
MKAEARSLTFLANEGSVKIPFFQRAYIWNKDNWDELISDLLESGKSHFLGSLILKQVDVPSGNTKQVMVIDGQQRLTTLSILLRTLYDSFDTDTQEACKQDLETCLFYKKRPSSKELFVKIEHSKVDCKHFQSVIRKEIDPDSLDLCVSESNILKCYKFFTDHLVSVDMEKRVSLFDDLMDDDKKILVVIDLTDADDEQSIFDTINSAGVRLSSADIVKNVLFQRAFDLYENNEEVEKLYKDNWEIVFASDEQSIAFWAAERTLGRLKRDNLEILLHSIAVIEGFFDPEKHTLTDLANIYKAHINGLNSSELARFIGAITEYAKLYWQKMYVFDNSDLFGYADYEKRLFHILSICDVSTFHPYILYLYRNYAGNEAALKSVLHKLETLIVRRFVCNSETKNYNKLCKEIIWDSSKLDATLAETSDVAFEAALQQIKNKPAALLLFWVELYRRSKDNRYDRDELKYTYTLEHIMPQKWEEYWSVVPVIGDGGIEITDIEAAKQHRSHMICSIGNMTLLKSSLNTALRNYEFKRKVEGEGRKHGIKHYAELGITKLDIVAPFEAGDLVWDETKINKRCGEIADDVLAIWS